MASFPSNAADLEQCRRVLIARAALERHAMRDATENLQIATDRIARIATLGISLVRRYWLPAGVLLASVLFKRARPVLRAARTGLAIWQTARLLRNARR
ncbi:MAG TPA: hypothetical protein VGQ35_07090 [Dongiaceae bacterium]|nr:hypothetical protein [Dongiaceae bacterium]